MTGKISALSVAILMFLVVEESAVVVFEITSQALPLRNCTCESIMVMDGPISQDMNSIELKAGKDNMRAINMIDSATGTLRNSTHFWSSRLQ